MFLIINHQEYENQNNGEIESHTRAVSLEQRSLKKREHLCHSFPFLIQELSHVQICHFHLMLNWFINITYESICVFLMVNIQMGQEAVGMLQLPATGSGELPCTMMEKWSKFWDKKK